ncbi:MAG: hypothetical protein V4757_02505 [Pseudomonadota bacterium]
MRWMFVLLALAGSVPASAQMTGPGVASAQLQEAQRRAEIRRVLQERQFARPGEAVPSGARRLTLQERAELREALRNQRPAPGESRAKP